MHLSYSSIKDFNFCPHYYKLTRIEKLRPFTGNVYTAFGTAIHSVCEKMIIDKFGNLDVNSCFKTELDKEFSNIDDEVSEDKHHEFYQSGVRILENLPKFMKEKFGEYEVIDTEKDLRVPIEFDQEILTDFDFVGFVDCIIKTKDGRHHIIDWKTCSWGWDARKKSDTMTTYQLSYYKIFYNLITGVDFEKIDTHFVLLKRVNSKIPVELVTVSSGKKKVNNALKLLETAAYNVDNENFIKNRLSCSKCDFHKTSPCP